MKKRLIKFRGRGYDGKWKYGTYAYTVMYPESFKGHYISPKENE